MVQGQHMLLQSRSLPKRQQHCSVQTPCSLYSTMRHWHFHLRPHTVTVQTLPRLDIPTMGTVCVWGIEPNHVAKKSINDPKPQLPQPAPISEPNIWAIYVPLPPQIAKGHIRASFFRPCNLSLKPTRPQQ